MSDLRAEMTKRMMYILVTSDAHPVALADECLRQMEWARRHCCPVAKYESIEIDKNKYPGISGVRVVGTNPLTAAPADWNPTPTKEEPK